MIAAEHRAEVEHDAGEGTEPLKRVVFACLLASILTAVVFVPALDNDFIVVWDDGKYVVDNPHVARGLSWQGLGWALTEFHASNWHPLTWLSHMLDVELFGMAPRGHHLTSVVLHIVNTVLLLLVLYRSTGRLGPSTAVALLFGIHPLHVESVAWVSERKDVLSGLFFVLTLWLYQSYARRRTAGRYLAVLTTFALGLLSKPMLVTLPVVLLLWDVWPLRRLGRRMHRGAGSFRFLLLEKVPLLVLSAISSLITLAAQRAGGAVVEMEAVPLGSRIANALVAGVAYLRKTVWPNDLSPFYPWPADGHSPVMVLFAALLLAAITVVALMQLRTRPFIAIGWGLYVVMLIPVIGIVQVGRQSMADRYTYLPLLGVFLALAWCVHGTLDRLAPSMRQLFAGIGIGVVSAVSIGQVGLWKDGVTLFEHASRVSDAPYSRFNLAASMVEAGRLEEAIAEYRRLLGEHPGDATSRYYLADALWQADRHEEAIGEYARAVRDGLRRRLELNNAGAYLARAGDIGAAEEAFRRAVEIAPGNAMAHHNYAGVLRRMGRFEQAVEQYRMALDSDPELIAAHEGLAMAAYLAGDDRSAWASVVEMRRLGREPNPAFVRELAARTPPPPGAGAP